jgi:hypothetical protein
MSNKPEWLMGPSPFRGEVNDAFIGLLKKTRFGEYIRRSGQGLTLILADFVDDPRYDGGSEYDVRFRETGDGTWGISFPMNTADKITRLLQTELRVEPQWRDSRTMVASRYQCKQAALVPVRLDSEIKNLMDLADGEIISDTWADMTSALIAAKRAQQAAENAGKVVEKYRRELAERLRLMTRSRDRVTAETAARAYAALADAP